MGASLFPEATQSIETDLGEFGTDVEDISVLLRPWIASVRSQSIGGRRARTFARLPESASSLVVRARDDGTFGVVAVGPRRRAVFKAAMDVPPYTRFAFQPGAARLFLDVPLYEIVDRAVPIEELWGAGSDVMRAELERARGSVRATVHVVETALRARLEHAEAHVARCRLVLVAARAIEANAGDAERIAAVAKRVGVSERQLRTVFREEIGVSPKRFARIARMRRTLANAEHAGWATIALENGFYDQSHMNAEFRSLLGTTPRAFAAGEVPIEETPCSS